MTELPPAYRETVYRLVTALDETGVEWALTGSVSFRLQGVPVDPNDVDVQTTKMGAYEIESRFADAVTDPVTFVDSGAMRSYLGELELNGLPVEVIGQLQKRRPDGTWKPPVDITDHRRFVDLDDVAVPVLSLAYEADAYQRLGREDRAALLREYAADDAS